MASNLPSCHTHTRWQQLADVGVERLAKWQPWGGSLLRHTSSWSQSGFAKSVKTFPQRWNWFDLHVGSVSSQEYGVWTHSKPNAALQLFLIDCCRASLFCSRDSCSHKDRVAHIEIENEINGILCVPMHVSNDRFAPLTFHTFVCTPIAQRLPVFGDGLPICLNFGYDDGIGWRSPEIDAEIIRFRSSPHAQHCAAPLLTWRRLTRKRAVAPTVEVLWNHTQDTSLPSSIKKMSFGVFTSVFQLVKIFLF